MAEGEKLRLVAWSRELSAVHDRLREAVRVTHSALDEQDEDAVTRRELLLYCHGFCTALKGLFTIEGVGSFAVTGASVSR